jgi:dTDP-4-amino-4,6-dideoxygalactose transaminase
MKARVPFLDISAQVRPLHATILKSWSRILATGQFVLGAEGEALERECAGLLGCRFAVAVHSGTDALVIGLRALGVGPGDEVLTTAFSFFATAEAICLVGAKPVFCDIDPETFLMDPLDAARRASRRVKAILPVHLYGLPVPMAPFRSLARKLNAKILEDACQAFGASDTDGNCGTLGHAAAFSFYPTKNLGGAGDGGLLTTNDRKVADLALQLRNHGSTRRYWHERLGYCSRLDELQAVVLRAKLPHLKAWNLRRQALAGVYHEGLGRVRGIRLPSAKPSCIWHQYSIRVRDGRREALASHLAKDGVATSVFYPSPLHRQPAFAGKKAGSLPAAEQAAEEVLCLPIYPELKSSQQSQVIQSIRRFFR